MLSWILDQQRIFIIRTWKFKQLPSTMMDTSLSLQHGTVPLGMDVCSRLVRWHQNPRL